MLKVLKFLRMFVLPNFLQLAYKRLLGKGLYPFDLRLNAVSSAPEETWKGWSHLASDLGIGANGGTAKLVYNFICLREKLSLSQDDIKVSDNLLRMINAAFEVS
jgi:hypothetical protein